MNQLPYKDVKPVGAAGFYTAINATFRFLIGRMGEEGWREYLAELGRDYYAPVNRRWREEGLSGVAAYWRDFFRAEPGAEVECNERPDRVEVNVHVCPAIRHLRAEGREITPEFCRHCFYLGSVRAAEAGLEMRLAGGNGACTHTYAKPEAELSPQDMAAIREAKL